MHTEGDQSDTPRDDPGAGAPPPFRLIWHDSAVAREHLAAAFEQVLAWLAEDEVQIELW
jgi:hypothetical protein